MATDKFLDIHGGQVFVRIWEKNNNLIPVIMLHDSLGCVETWRDFPEILSQHLNRTVIAYDRLGFGKSSERIAPPSYGFIEEESKIIAKITQALELNEYILFGYSVGGAMSLIAAKNNPQCKAVISESAQVFVEEQTKAGIINAIAFYQDPVKFDKLKKYHGEKTTWVFKAWTDTWLAPEFANWSLLSYLPDVLCPVLVIHGDKDEYGSLAFPDGIATTVAGNSKKVILHNCGHIPHREHETEVLSEVKSFLDQTCP